MTAEMISWSLFTEVKRLSWDSNLRYLDLLSDLLRTVLWRLVNLKYFSGMANRVDPDQTAPERAV